MSQSVPIVGATPQWSVVSTSPATGQDPAGRTVSGWMATYEIQGSGATGRVFVPSTVSQDAQRAIINADAVKLHGLNNLTS